MKKGMFALIVLGVLVFAASAFAGTITQNVMAVVVPNETDQIIINEFVVDPQTNWNGLNGPIADDEWFELYNADTEEVNLTGWNLTLIDTGTSREVLQGSLLSGEYLAIKNPAGDQRDDGRIVLYDNWGREVDSVSYGNYNDGNLADNAPNGTAQDAEDECLARIPNGIDTGVDLTDFRKTKCTKELENQIPFVNVTIEDNSVSPFCPFESENVIVSAFINGSISQVILSLNSGDGWRNITLEGNQAKNYTYLINSSELSGDEDLEWRFIVKDTQENFNFGVLRSANINSRTIVLISAELGTNNWYLSQPVFNLNNSDNPIEVFYQWDSADILIYDGSFGLENEPSGANVTGGLAELNWWGNFTCDGGKTRLEPVQTENFKFDFFDPEFESPVPADLSAVFGNARPEIQVLIDEKYQGNSGVNHSAISMLVDGSSVPAVVSTITSMKSLVSYTPTSDLAVGVHTVSVHAEDKAGRSSDFSWSFEIASLQTFNIFVYSPLPGIYTDKRLPINVSLTREAEKIEYINYNDRSPRFTKLCSNCDSYGFNSKSLKSFNEGENNVTIRAEDPYDGFVEFNTVFVIDSEEPNIISTSPTRGFSSGLFEIEFEEDNPTELIIHYGNLISGMREKNVNISADCLLDRNYECETQVDLIDYDGEAISYYVTVEDIAGNKDESSEKELDVDISDPIINSFSSELDGKYATFTLNITEPYFDEVKYIDNLADKPKESTLCSKLTNGVCTKKVSFSDDGNHNVTIIVYDEAGNTAEVKTFFFTDSKEPSIVETNPARGLTNGFFEIVFREENPTELFLNYGNSSETRNKKLNLTECTPDRSDMVCNVFVDLTDFESQEITYWFNLTDVVGNFEESRERELVVDTTSPVVNSFNYTIEGRKVIFEMNVTEPNLDKIEYIDELEAKPKFKMLCSSLKNGICDKSVSFSKGSHIIDIRAIDEAGNEKEIIGNLSFSLD